MGQKEFFSARTRMLQTPAYQGTAGFPEEVEKTRTIRDLVWWLGHTPFPPNSTEEAVAISELLTILSSFNLNDLPTLLKYLRQTAMNVGVPSQRSIQAVEDALGQGNSARARYLAGRCLSLEVKRWRPTFRVEIADWIARRV